jgi:23S rRNA pseudouridine955/2504/2580 synthase
MRVVTMDAMNPRPKHPPANARSARPKTGGSARPSTPGQAAAASAEKSAKNRGKPHTARPDPRADGARKRVDARPKGVRPAVAKSAHGERANSRPARPNRPSGETRAMRAPAVVKTAPAPVPAPPSEVRLVTVDEERVGQRIDNYLGSLLKGVPKSAIYRLLRTGQVRINGKRAKPENKLASGDIVRIPPVRLDAPDAPAKPGASLRGALDEAVLYEDRELLVLNKPSGLASHGGSGVSLGAIEALRAIRPQDTLELVHRLDRDTSGLLLFAKKHSALRKLQTLIREGKVRKQYFALIQGTPERDHYEVDAPLRKNQLRSGERMVAVEDDGKPSLSLFRIVERFAAATLVEVEIITGRTHQIRVHALHSGHPLAGDDKYGDADFNKQMRSLGLKRLFLHAHSLEFPWGEQGQTRHYNAPLGPELKAALAALGPALP